jgi:large subunit ribosomal protein L7/L12
MADLKKLAEEIVNLTLLEAAGAEEDPQGRVRHRARRRRRGDDGAGPAAGCRRPAEEEKTEFDVILVEARAPRRST